MLTDQLSQQLAARLAKPLPGSSVHRRFEPELSYGRPQGPAPSGARRGAVVALLYRHAGAWYLPLTRRPETMVEHSGQISLPGGQVEPGETSRQAALRELNEELGVAIDPRSILGQLSPIYVYVSNYMVTPWIASIQYRPQWVPRPDEVAEVLEVPLDALVDPANVQDHLHEHRGVTFRAPHFQWKSDRIWGATSTILGELVEILGELKT